ncbi:MAG: HEPN domain-containing protein [Candidatus Aenigmatarchaeota archaeon]
MSQASNKVKWCLDKAKKELAEIGMHRGLVEQEQDYKVAALHIAKARHNLNAALFFEKNNYSDWSASAFFYCIYHCFLAILRRFGYESRNQECTIAVIEMLKEQGKIAIDDKFISTLKISQAEDKHSVIKIREDFQYGTDIEFQKKEQFEELTIMCKEAIEATNRVIFSK